MRTLVAGHAALLALGLDESAYDRVGTIVVRSRAMRRTAPMAGPAQGVLMDAPGAVDGEAHHADGPIMLVWPSARREARNPRLGRDVVLHEFSHKLDMLDGTLDGTPPIDDAALRGPLGRGVHRRVPGRARRHGRVGPAAVRRHEPGRVLRRRDRDVLHPAARSCRTPSRRCTRSCAAYYRQDPADRAALRASPRRRAPTASTGAEVDRGPRGDRSEHVREVASHGRLRREVGPHDAVEAEPAPGPSPPAPRHQVPRSRGSWRTPAARPVAGGSRPPVAVDVVDDDDDLSSRRPPRPHCTAFGTAASWSSGRRVHTRPASADAPSRPPGTIALEHLGQRPSTLGRVRRVALHGHQRGDRDRLARRERDRRQRRGRVHPVARRPDHRIPSDRPAGLLQRGDVTLDRARR